MITSDTVQANQLSHMNSAKTLQQGYELNQVLLLSGHINENNSLKATKIMEPLYENWKLQGYASKVNKNKLNIGSLVINRCNEDILDCNIGIKNGLLIEVIMQANNSYEEGDAINSLLSVRCLTNEQTQDDLPMVVQGFVTQKQGQNFWVNGVNVKHNTVFENGEKNFINSAVNIEVQGSFDAEILELDADVIRFIEHRIELTFPVYPSDIILGESIIVNGFVFNKTPQTIDNHDILSNGINSARQVDIQGFVDNSGKLYISKVKLKGQPNYEMVSMRGDISEASSPLFSLLNFEIPGFSNTLIDENNTVLSAEEFFQAVQNGSQVEVKNGEFLHASNLITNAVITIKSPNNSSSQKGVVNNLINKEIIGSGIINASVGGTVTNVTMRRKQIKFID